MGSVEQWPFERDGKLYCHVENDGPRALRRGLEQHDTEIVGLADDRSRYVKLAGGWREYVSHHDD
jgi:hypothetical protein